jgi:F-type H+-transporting ATPase subunit gamma
MSGAREIRSKIKSVKSTQKITRAMEMVAASKMRKAQLRMQAARPYAARIQEVISHIADGGRLDYSHPYLVTRPEQRVGLMVISTDRGLCGGLNVNLFRSVIGEMQQHKEKNATISLTLLGSKGEAFFKRFGGNIWAAKSRVGDAPTISDVVGPLRVMLDAYNEGRLDSLYLCYNQFVNTMSQKPCIKRLLPIIPEDAQSSSQGPSWDYLYEPDAGSVLDLLLERYIEMQVYHGTVENFACEQAARMVAMKSASENAGDFVDGLQLAYNKARQAAITRELAEIVSGAAAV